MPRWQKIAASGHPAFKQVFKAHRKSGDFGDGAAFPGSGRSNDDDALPLIARVLPVLPVLRVLPVLVGLVAIL